MTEMKPINLIVKEYQKYSYREMEILIEEVFKDRYQDKIFQGSHAKYEKYLLKYI